MESRERYDSSSAAANEGSIGEEEDIQSSPRTTGMEGFHVVQLLAPDRGTRLYSPVSMAINAALNRRANASRPAGRGS